MTVAPGPAPRPRLFISYSRADSAAIADLVAALETAGGVEVFRDTADILPTEEWKGRLADLVTRSDAVVFCLSANSARSEVCAWEVRHALSLNKRILPVLIGGLEDAVAPEGLSRLNYIDARFPAVVADVVTQIIASAGTDIAWVRQHSRLSEAAQRWLKSLQSRDMLLRGAELVEAERWLASRPPKAPEPTDLQRTFLAAGRQWERSRWRTLIGAISVVLLIVAGAAGVIDHQRRTAWRKAHDLVVSEVSAAAVTLDSRLLFIRQTVSDPAFGALLMKRVREKVGIADDSDPARAFDKLMLEQRIAGLRQKLNGAPLPLQMQAEVLRVVRDAGAPPDKVRELFAAISSVQDRTEDLFTMLRSAADEKCHVPETRSYHEGRIALGARAVEHDSRMALRHGLELLRAINADPVEIDRRLSHLLVLEPKVLPRADGEVATLLERDYDSQLAILEERRRLGQLQSQLIASCTAAELAEIDRLVTIGPADTFEEVLAKALSLRQLGRTDDAVAAFETARRRFRSRMADIDAYAETGQAFTRAMPRLPFRGGVYVDLVTTGGKGEAAGLKAGDIIVSYAGQAVELPPRLLSLIEANAGQPAVPLTILRRIGTGHSFEELNLVAVGGKLDIRLWPI